MLIQPIVLVGGRSQRFGRDKLREPMGPRAAGWLVDRPIAALRQQFGERVAVVGDCSDAVSARADLVIPDRYPGIGPAGGILSALEWGGGAVFVLAGDLPNVTIATVRCVLDAGAAVPHDDVWAVLADAEGLQPCIGMYRQIVRERLAARVSAGRYGLQDLVPEEHLRRVATSIREAANVNRISDLPEVDLPVVTE